MTVCDVLATPAGASVVPARPAPVQDVPAAALLRYRMVAQFRDMMEEFCAQSGVKVPNNAFTRWFVDQPHGGQDALFPDVPAFEQFRGELRQLDASEAVLDAVQERMRSLASTFGAALAAVRQAAAQPPGAISIASDGGTARVTYKDASFTVNATHFAKLQGLYAAAGGQPDSWPPALFCLLARYGTLGELGDAGFHGALHERVFEALEEHFGVEAECFASPLNCRLQKFCSAFPDVDTPFGSRGSFFEYHPEEGSFEVNPPFTEPLMAAAATHMEELLGAAAEAGRPLSFAVFIPCWVDSACWRTMRGSRHLTRFFVVPKGRHSYIVGNQHVASRRYFPAAFDTGVFFLQTAAGMARWPPSDASARALRTAFDATHLELSRRGAEQLRNTLQRKHARDAAAQWSREEEAYAEYVSPALAALQAAGQAQGEACSEGEGDDDAQPAKHLCASCPGDVPII